jgi:hypothetical protein
MFRQSVRDLVKLKKFEDSHVNLKEKWCEEQQVDLENILEMVDDLITSAIASTSSSHGYTQLQEAKSTFVNAFMSMAAQYRHI